MAADSDDLQSFKDGRANLRDTAKWLLSGIAAVLTLMGGSSVLSQLGSRSLWDSRSVWAMTLLALAIYFFWKPFRAAVDVLKSETCGLRSFIAANQTKADKRSEIEKDQAAAFENASLQLAGYLPFGSISGLVTECDRLRGIIFTNPGAAPSPAAQVAQDNLPGLETIEIFALETCISALVYVRFNKLIDSLWRFGGMSFIFFTLFVWAANPPKDVPKVFDKPIDLSFVLSRQPDNLRRAGVAPECVGPGAALFAVSGFESGVKSAIFLPQQPAAQGCAPRRLVLSSDYSIVRAE